MKELVINLTDATTLVLRPNPNKPERVFSIRVEFLGAYVWACLVKEEVLTIRDILSACGKECSMGMIDGSYTQTSILAVLKELKKVYKDLEENNELNNMFYKTLEDNVDYL